MNIKGIALKFILTAAPITGLLLNVLQADAQSIHFSQYYNAPLLQNPANTALMPDNDFRMGVNYRNQWATVPVPYNTFSGFADFKAFINKSTSNNWLGLGFALFNDKAGDGNLQLTSLNGYLAYHLQLNSSSLISAGLSGGYVERSVDYNDLTFDAQWDGFTFNRSLGNQEMTGIAKTNYYTIAAGINYAYDPNPNAYFNIGLSVANINQPKESFYNEDNVVAMRPAANVDGVFRISTNWIISPSIYFAEQSGATELVYGTLFRVNIGGQRDIGTQFLFGAYNRWGDAIIGATGIQWGRLQFMCTYDATISGLGQYNGGEGAMEFSLIYQGLYAGREKGPLSYNCPRF